MKIVILSGAVLLASLCLYFAIQTNKTRPAPEHLQVRKQSAGKAPQGEAQIQEMESPSRKLALQLASGSTSAEESARILAGRSDRNLIFRELGAIDFSLALKLAASIQNPNILISNAVWGYATVRPIEALSWAKENPFKSRQGDIQNEYLRYWAAGAYQSSPAILFRIVSELPANQPVLTETHDLISGIELFVRTNRAYQHLFEDTHAARLLASLNFDPRITGPADARLFTIAADWARADQASLLRFASIVDDPVIRQPVLRAAVIPQIADNPAAAIEWAIGVDPDQRLGVVRTGFLEWSNSLASPESILEWTKDAKIERPYVDTATAIVAAKTGSKDFARGYELARDIVNESDRMVAYQKVSTLWRDNELHFDYIKRSTDTSLQKAAVSFFSVNQPGRAEVIRSIIASRTDTGAESTVGSKP